ncbi:cellulose synthase subunit BcsC-related outer membrane protein [Paraburkholderia sp. RL17-368-BIF-A]|uniref:cellulose synthase subunit BcsC-related outer membrane protein n=1 Tax=Paraburkholderia sp. RL17-368-BIF-A TaxID=3031628 RepID=UPI0038C7B6E0
MPSRETLTVAVRARSRIARALWLAGLTCGMPPLAHAVAAQEAAAQASGSASTAPAAPAEPAQARAARSAGKGTRNGGAAAASATVAASMSAEVSKSGAAHARASAAAHASADSSARAAAHASARAVAVASAAASGNAATSITTTATPSTANPTPAASAADSANISRLYATARLWSAKRRDDLAKQAIDKALLIAPQSPVLLAELVSINLRLGQAQAAQAALTKLHQAAPGSKLAQQSDDEFRVATSGRGELATIRLLARSGQSEEAARRLEALFPHGAPSGPLGAEYYSIVAGTPDGRVRAVAALRARLAADPADAQAAMALAGLLNRSSDTRPEAERIARSLATRNDVDHGAAMDLWHRVLQSAGPDPAYVQGLSAYVALAPDDTEFHDRLAVVKDKVDAQRRLESNPDYIAQKRGLALLSRNDLAAADPLLTRAAQARSDDAEAVGGLGLLRMREGRQDEAQKLFQRAAQLAPDNRAKWTGLARTAQFWATLTRARQAAAAGRPDEAARLAREALAMNVSNTDAKLVLADSLLAQKDWANAEPLLKELLSARDPSLATVRSTATLFDNTGRDERIGPLLDAVQNRFRAPADRAELAQIRADNLVAQAERLSQQGLRAQAIDRYEAALRAAPDSPWTRFALARIYRDLGLPQLGRTVMDEGLKASDSPEMHYAAALYRNSTDDLAGARALLASVPAANQTDAMRAFGRNLDAQQALVTARAAYAAGDAQAGKAALDQAAALGADDANLTASVGSLEIDMGQPDRGLARLADWMKAHPQQTDDDVRLRYGDLLGSAHRDDELDAWLRDLRNDAALTAAQRARLQDQSVRLALRRTDAAIDAGDYRRAAAVLAAVDEEGQRDPRYTLEVADLQRAQGQFAGARATLEKLLAEHPDDPDAQLALARVLQESGKRREALDLVHGVVEQSAPDDIDTRLSAARRLAALRRPYEAQTLTDELASAFPDRYDVTAQQGRISEDLGRYDDAAALYRKSEMQERSAGVSPGPNGTPAQVALSDLEQRRDPSIEAAWYPAYKSGDEGISNYHAQQVPIYAQLPVGYDGHVFAHVDVVNLDAGTLSSSDSSLLDTLGTHAALADSSTAAVASFHQHATGAGGGIGYRSDNLRFDLGTTPIGFPVHYLVGGVRYRMAGDDSSFTVNLSRRPQTSSELSYAGLRDPWTGAVWGGVRRDGLDVHSSVDVGRVNLFADVGAGMFTGRNVASNTGITLRTGATVPVFERADMRVSTGVVGNAWHYANNLRFYTFGQGGYYSPQRYLSLGFPVEWQGRRGAWRWDLTATVGVSNSYERSSPFYPNGLPASAALNPAALSNSNNVYGASSTRGVSFLYGLTGVVEHRFSPNLVAGLLFDIDRSHDYAPSSAMVYVRYNLDARKPDTSLSPTPTRLYSSY